MFLCHQTHNSMLFGMKRHIVLLLFSSCPLRGNRDLFGFDLSTPCRQIFFSLISKHIICYASMLLKKVAQWIAVRDWCFLFYLMHNFLVTMIIGLMGNCWICYANKTLWLWFIQNCLISSWNVLLHQILQTRSTNMLSRFILPIIMYSVHAQIHSDV